MLRVMEEAFTGASHCSLSLFSRVCSSLQPPDGLEEMANQL